MTGRFETATALLEADCLTQLCFVITHFKCPQLQVRIHFVPLLFTCQRQAHRLALALFVESRSATESQMRMFCSTLRTSDLEIAAEIAVSLQVVIMPPFCVLTNSVWCR